MNLLRLLIIVAVVWLLLQLWRSARRGGRHGASGTPPQVERQAQEMVRCAQCGVHLPRGEALGGEGAGEADHYYCCAEHQHLGPRG